MEAPPLIPKLEKASANVPAAPVCTVRLQCPWCWVASAVSLVEAKRPCIRIETGTRVMLVVDRWYRKCSAAPSPIWNTLMYEYLLYVCSGRYVAGLHIQVSYLGWWRGSWAQDWHGWGVKADTHGGLLNMLSHFTRSYVAHG